MCTPMCMKALNTPLLVAQFILICVCIGKQGDNLLTFVRVC